MKEIKSACSNNLNYKNDSSSTAHRNILDYNNIYKDIRGLIDSDSLVDFDKIDDFDKASNLITAFFSPKILQDDILLFASLKTMGCLAEAYCSYELPDLGKIVYPDKVSLPINEFSDFYFKELSNLAFVKRKLLAYNDVRNMRIQFLKDNPDVLSYKNLDGVFKLYNNSVDCVSKTWCSVFMTKDYVHSDVGAYEFISQTKQSRCARKYISVYVDSLTNLFNDQSEDSSSINQFLDDFKVTLKHIECKIPSKCKKVEPLLEKILGI